MNSKISFLFAAPLLALFLDISAVKAQYTPTPYRYGSPARLSPYLNLARDVNNDNILNPAINYFLGVLPERERRFNANLFNTRIRTLEQKVEAPIPSTIAEIPAVPTAGKPIGSRTSASYFREDGALRNPSRTRR